MAVALWLVACILPAAADSRNLVVERLSRCYTLSDTRQYLDCIYAAAQPLRSDLGLAPAPQAQTYVPLFSRPAAPSANIPPQAAKPVVSPQQEASSSSGGGFNILGISSKMVAPEQFGLQNAKPGPGLNVDHINARMTSYTIDKRTGWFTVVLENGQVWERVGGAESNPYWTKAASFYTATVEYGAMGSFNMIVNDGTPQVYKVRRTR